MIAQLLLFWLSLVGANPTPAIVPGQALPVASAASQTAQAQHIPLYQILQVQAKAKPNLMISTLGSSVTAGSGSSGPEHVWIHQLSKDLKTNKGLEGIRYRNNGFGGYTTGRILKENKIDVVVQQQADVIFFETCLINDYRQNVQIEKTKSNIREIYAQLQEKLPASRIILTSANPITEGDKPNTTGLSYEEYVKQIEAFAAENSWDYFNIFEPFQNDLKQANLALKDVLSDQIHPNNQGYKIWSTILIDYVKQGKIE